MASANATGSLRALLLSTALGLGLTACASTDVGSRTAGQTAAPSSSVEASLMRASDIAEKDVRIAGSRITDPALESYVYDLTRKVSGDFSDELRVYLIEAPAFNAAMLPNGAMLVYSGLLLRADSEAELAQVLGHEFGHYYEQHSLKRRIRAENTSNMMTAFNIATLGYGSIAVAVAGIGSFTAYSREQETEADLIGQRRATDAGYDPQAAPALWGNLLDEMAASSNKKVRKRSKKTGSALFDTHPPSTARVAALDVAAKSLSGSQQGGEAYRARIRPYLLDWFEAELQGRDFGSVLALVERKRGYGEDLGVLGYVEGRAYDLRNEAGDRQRALDAWQSASTRSDAPAQLFRDLGNLLQKLDRDAEARDAFRTYLQKAPDAPDAALVRSLIS